MPLRLEATGTIVDLEQLWPWDKLCEMIRVDYYKKHLVPEGETFTVTQDDLKKVGLVKFDEDRRKHN